MELVEETKSGRLQHARNLLEQAEALSASAARIATKPSTLIEELKALPSLHRLSSVTAVADGMKAFARQLEDQAKSITLEVFK